MRSNLYSTRSRKSARINPFPFIAPLAILLLLACPADNKAQGDEIHEMDHINQILFREASPINFLEYEYIEGKPYSNKELTPATIEFIDGRLIENLPMRYNIYAKKMEFKQDEQLLELAEIKEIKHIILENNKYVPFFRIPSIGGYMIELYSGNISLFKQSVVEFVDAKPAKTGYEDPKPAHFDRKDDAHILITEEGEIIRLSSNKSHFARQFPDNEERILSYIKKQGLKLGREDDLISMVRELDSWKE
ncbi:MAG: hypothetical protein JW801_13100 [Bacteroidales bacterium]|nr:hypothetical protein [Bacteroidales bacterium]